MAALLRAGRREEAAPLLAVRWEAELDRLWALHGGAEPPPPPQPSTWGPGTLAIEGRPILRAELERLLAPDLDRLDLLRLVAAFPRRQDGRWRLNTSRVLRRYPVHDLVAPHRRLVLLAWTPGTATLWDRPEDRGLALLTVSLVTRSTRGETLPEEAWRA